MLHVADEIINLNIHQALGQFASFVTAVRQQGFKLSHASRSKEIPENPCLLDAAVPDIILNLHNAALGAYGARKAIVGRGTEIPVPMCCILIATAR